MCEDLGLKTKWNTMSEILLDSPVVYKMGREFSVSTEGGLSKYLVLLLSPKNSIMKLEGVHDFVWRKRTENYILASQVERTSTQVSLWFHQRKLSSQILFYLSKDKTSLVSSAIFHNRKFPLPVFYLKTNPKSQPSLHAILYLHIEISQPARQLIHERLSKQINPIPTDSYP